MMHAASFPAGGFRSPQSFMPCLITVQDHSRSVPRMTFPLSPLVCVNPLCDETSSGLRGRAVGV